MSSQASRPDILVASCFMHADPERKIFKGKTLLYTEQRMARTIWRAGGMPIGHLEVPEDPDGIARAMVARCDGLLLQGGSDCAPESYGETPMKPEWAGDRIRDDYEMRLVKAAIEMNKPILGICRGHQILNVALGGTLFQDIETQVDDVLVHRDWDRYGELSHDVEIDAESWLHGVYGSTKIISNSVHHQSVKAVAPGLKITARAPDGIVEAIEDRSDERWVVGVQWHPEWLDGEDPGPEGRSEGDPIFGAFVEHCRQVSSAG